MSLKSVTASENVIGDVPLPGAIIKHIINHSFFYFSFIFIHCNFQTDPDEREIWSMNLRFGGGGGCNSKMFYADNGDLFPV